jgi:hypothetical protein
VSEPLPALPLAYDTQPEPPPRGFVTSLAVGALILAGAAIFIDCSAFVSLQYGNFGRYWQSQPTYAIRQIVVMIVQLIGNVSLCVCAILVLLRSALAFNLLVAYIVTAMLQQCITIVFYLLPPFAPRWSAGNLTEILLSLGSMSYSVGSCVRLFFYLILLLILLRPRVKQYLKRLFAQAE